MNKVEEGIIVMVVVYIGMWLIIRLGPSKIKPSFKEWMKATLWPFKEKEESSNSDKRRT